MFDLSQFRIPVGDWAAAAVSWMTDNLSALFTAISTSLFASFQFLENILLGPPEIVIVIIFVALAWIVGNWKFALFTGLSFILVIGMALWSETMSTLSMVLVSSIIAAVLGIPLGILSARYPRFDKIMQPILDFMQTMPAFVYLIPAIIFFGIGIVPGVVATIIFAMPPATRMTRLGLLQVDPETVEAGEAFGATSLSILAQVKIPLALPSIMAGINQVIMLALSMVVTAGIVGAGGLGASVYRGVTRLDVGLGFEAGLSVVVLAVFLDRMTSYLGKRFSERKKKGGQKKLSVKNGD